MREHERAIKPYGLEVSKTLRKDRRDSLGLSLNLVSGAENQADLADLVEGMEEGAENDGARKRRKPPRGADAGGGGGGSGDDSGGSLTGLAAVQGVFHFLPAPADVLRAATACRRWRELACADSVWRAKAEREGILDKAAAFEVEVPLVAEGGSHEDEATASMAFYARVFVLKVRGRLRGGGRGRSRTCIRLTTGPHCRPRARRARPPRRGTR